jgi:hypothetical protein
MVCSELHTFSPALHRPKSLKKRPKTMPKSSLLGKAGKGLITLLLSPFLIAGAILYMVMWILGIITCIGPLIQSMCSSGDRKKLLRCIRPCTGAVVDMVALPSQGGRKVAVRWSKGADPTLSPVCIPNGLGATLISIAMLHDLLEAKGYPVLSFDRGGVGLSEPLAPGRATVS